MYASYLFSSSLQNPRLFSSLHNLRLFSSSPYCVRSSPLQREFSSFLFIALFLSSLSNLGEEQEEEDQEEEEARRSQGVRIGFDYAIVVV